MIVKCTKTGKILANDDEIREHSEAFGVASFEEIAPDTTIIWMNPESGKYCFTKAEMDQFCRRTGEPSDAFVQMSVTEFFRIQSEKKQRRRNDPLVEGYANGKFLAVLVDVRGHLALVAEKALWYTRNESVSAAEEWISEHRKDADFTHALTKPTSEEIADRGILSSRPASTGAVSEESQILLSDWVSSEYQSDLLSMGFDKDRAVLGLWKTGNVGVAAAVEWLSSLSEENLLALISEMPKYVSKVETSTSRMLSKEEAQAAALQLQKKLREERIAREALEAKEKEKQRIISAKLALEQQAQMEEAQRRRDLAERERLKKEQEQHKAEVAEKLRLDYIDRFGVEPPQPSLASQTGPVGKPKDRILIFLTQIKKNYSIDIAKSCLATLRIYLHNIEQNSSDKKFHKIKTSNKTFVEKIAPVSEAVEILRVCGFENVEADPNESANLEIKASIADGWLCGQAVKYIDVILAGL